MVWLAFILLGIVLHALFGDKAFLFPPSKNLVGVPSFATKLVVVTINDLLGAQLDSCVASHANPVFNSTQSGHRITG